MNSRSHHEPTFWDEARSPLLQFCHRGTFALILFTLVITPLFFGTAKPWTHGPVVAAVALAAVLWVIQTAVAKESRVLFSLAGAPLVLFLVYVIVRYALADVEPVARPVLLFDITVLLFGIVVLNNMRHRWQITVLTWVILGVGVVQSVAALLQVVHWIPTPAVHPTGATVMASGTFLRSGELAVYLHLCYALAAANFFFSRRSNPEKIGMAFAALVIVGGLVLTGSRWHWVGWFAAAGLLGAFVVRKRGWRSRWVVAGCIVLAVLAIGVLFLLHWLAGPTTSGDPAGSPSWRSAMTIARGKLLIGQGGGMFPWLYPSVRTVQGMFDRSMIAFLDVLTDYGLVGVGLMLWALVAFVVEVIRILLLRDRRYSANRMSNRYALGVGGLAVALLCLVDGWVDLNIRSGGILFAMVAIAASALTCGLHRRPDEPVNGWTGGYYNSTRLHGFSRFVIAAGLVGMVLLIATRLPRTSAAQWLIRQGHQALDDFDWNRAERDFRRALSLDQRNFEAAEALGDVLFARAVWDGGQREHLAKEVFRRYDAVRTINPYHLNSRIKAARLHDLLGNREAAGAAYQEAVLGDPRNATYRVQQGYHYLRWNDAAKAERCFREARRLGAVEILPIDETQSDDPDLFGVR